MNFYIASRIENAGTVSKLADVLKAMSWRHTYDWTIHGSVQHEGEQRLREVAEKEMQGVRDADIIIVALPGGRGTHAELGAAIALGKPIIIWAEHDDYFICDERTCVFYWNPGITRVVGDAVKFISELLNHPQIKD